MEVMEPSAGIGIFAVLFFLFLALAAQAFWLWMFVECLVKEPSGDSDKLLWGLIIFFGNLLGALLYFVVRRGERIERYGR